MGTPADVEMFRASVLRLHNEARRKHGAAPLTLSDKLNAGAQKWAEKMAADRKLNHSPKEPKSLLGENLFWHRKFQGSEDVAKVAVDSFYAEAEDYDFQGGKAKAGKVVGHFTQLVWRRCFDLGAGMAVSKTKNDVYVCLSYDPPGNYDGGYTDNVHPEGATPAPAPTLLTVPDIVCKYHNELRARHSAPPLCINSFLSRQAQEWADTLARSQDFDTPSRFCSNTAIVSELSPVLGVDTWYEKGAGYDYARALPSEATAAFTQLLWKGTSRIGVGLGVGRPWTCLVVFYDPGGNSPATPAAFRLNVLPPAPTPPSTAPNRPKL